MQNLPQAAALGNSLAVPNSETESALWPGLSTPQCLYPGEMKTHLCTKTEYSQQYQSQLPKNGNNPKVHQLVNKYVHWWMLCIHMTGYDLTTQGNGGPIDLTTR